MDGLGTLHKAGGPGGVPGYTCFKTPTIIPVLKISAVKCMNDHQHVALTTVECFERLFSHIRSIITPDYWENCCTKDGYSTVFHTLGGTKQICEGTICKLQFCI